MSSIRLARIDLYPIKSLDPVSVESAEIDVNGALKYDRAFALFDEAGGYINGKRDKRVHQVRAAYSADLKDVTLGAPNMPACETELKAGDRDLEDWLSRYFERPVYIKEKTPGGFPDDTDRPGPTLVGRATLARVREWLREDAGHKIELDELRRRFRTNLELEGGDSFAEDAWYGETLLAGQIRIQALSPCARCVVPTRDTRTGEPTRAFAKILTDRRRQELPKTVDPGRFDHFYRLAVNTAISPDQAGMVLRVGDEIRTEFQLDFEL